MNRSKLIRNLLSVTCACLALAACTTNQTGMSNAGASTANSKTGARLIVHRSPTFGSGYLTLTLDGAQVDNLELGRTYDSYVSAGQHVLTAVHTPNLSGQRPYSVTFTAVAGQTYSYIARWQDTDLVLVRDLGSVRAHE